MKLTIFKNVFNIIEGFLLWSSLKFLWKRCSKSLPVNPLHVEPLGKFKDIHKSKWCFSSWYSWLEIQTYLNVTHGNWSLTIDNIPRVVPPPAKKTTKLKKHQVYDYRHINRILSWCSCEAWSNLLTAQAKSIVFILTLTNSSTAVKSYSVTLQCILLFPWCEYAACNVLHYCSK